MRCKACNNVLSEGEIIWDTQHKTFEELCKVCRAVVGTSLAEFEEDYSGNVMHTSDVLSDEDIITSYDDEVYYD